VPPKTRVMRSPITGQAQIYYEHTALMTCEQAEPVDTRSLKTLMNSELANAGYDAFVDDVKIFQGWADTSVQAHMWIAGESPVGPWTALAILALVVGVVATVYIIATSAQTIIEHFWPQPKFYQYDAEGNAIVVNSLAEYVTCQEATHPGKYVCHYCGQVFDTKEERDAHEETCPWREGVPGQPPSYVGLIILGLGAVVVIGGIWAVAKIFGREKGPPIIIAR